jgi:hypothetical protein
MEYGKTAHNRIVCAAPAVAGLAYRKTQSGLRPFVRFSSGTFFCALKLLRGFFIGRKKTSHTTGTLCAVTGLSQSRQQMFPNWTINKESKQ